MPDNPQDVVSDATETTESSSADTQTGAEPQTAEPKNDWRRLQKEDADLNAHVQSEIARARTRWQRQQLRNSAKQAVDANSPEHSLAVARQVAAEQDEPDEDEQRDAGWSQSADRVQPQLERLLSLDTNGRATNPYYVQLHQREGRAAMDKRYAEDPVAFVNWVDDQIMDMRVHERVTKVAPSLAGAMAQDAEHTRLRGQPVPIGGSNTASGALTLNRYESMTFAERQKLRKDNPRAIDEMIARAAR